MSGGLADPGLAFELVPVIDRACRLAHGLLVPTARGGTSILCTSILAVARYQSLLVKLVLWSHRTPKCHIGAQCTVGPTRRLNIREECCLQAKRTTEKVVMPSCYTMVVSRTWRGMLHDNMVTMWVHISERGRPGAAPSQVMLMEAQRHQVSAYF